MGIYPLQLKEVAECARASTRNSTVAKQTGTRGNSNLKEMLDLFLPEEVVTKVRLAWPEGIWNDPIYIKTDLLSAFLLLLLLLVASKPVQEKEHFLYHRFHHFALLHRGPPVSIAQSV
jgi:hypothetical protein